MRDYSHLPYESRPTLQYDGGSLVYDADSLLYDPVGSPIPPPLPPPDVANPGGLFVNTSPRGRILPVPSRGRF